MISKNDLKVIAAKLKIETEAARFYSAKIAEQRKLHRATLGTDISLNSPYIKELHENMWLAIGRKSVYEELLEEYERQHDQTRNKK